MGEFMRRVFHAERGLYLQWLGILAVLAVGLFAWMSLSGCGELGSDPGCGGIVTGPATSSSWSSGLTAPQPSTFKAVMAGVTTLASPGERTYRHLRCEGTEIGTTVSYRYYPPGAAWDFSFSTPPDSVTSQSYEWRNLVPGAEVLLSFRFPILHKWDRNPYKGTESFSARTSDGGVSAVMHTTEIYHATAAGESPPNGLPPEAPRTEPQSQSNQIWYLIRWLDMSSDSMTTAVCEDLLDLLRSDDAFLALRVPVTPSAVVSEAASVPLLLGGDFVPQMQIYRYTPYPAMTVYSTTLELRPDRLHFLGNALPGAEGEEWLALGVPSDAPACPSGLNQAPGSWSFSSRIYLDLSGQPDYCRGCTLPFYVCYEGQSEPLTSQAAALALALAGSSPDMTAYSNQGITCLGPEAIQLTSSLVWKLAGAGTDIVTPTQSIQFHHYLVNRSGGTLSFNLTTESDLGVTWRIYGGTAEVPNLSQPITSPVAVADDEFKHFWLISDPLSADTAHGPYSLRLTAALVSSPLDLQWTGDMIWVGDWVAPPSEPTMHRIYLPVVFKSWRK